MEPQPPGSAADALPLAGLDNRAAIERGRRIARWLVGTVVAMGAFAMIASVIAVGSDRLVMTAVKLLVAIAVGLFLLEGKNWARWVLLVPLLADVWGFSGIVVRLVRADEVGAALPFATMVLLDAMLAWALVWSRDLRVFLAFSRATFDSEGP